MHARWSPSLLFFLGNGSFRLQARRVKGIYQARENSKQHGASAVMYFYISCYSGAHTVDSIEVKKNRCGDLRNTPIICFLSSNLESSHKVNMGLIPLHRLKTSERLFIHKNLLLSLGLGNLVFVLDKRLFTSRRDHVVCTKLRKSCFKQISSHDLLLNRSLKGKKINWNSPADKTNKQCHGCY